MDFQAYQNRVLIFQGKLRNLRQVLTLTCDPAGDGIDWEVREGCDAYTLTVEQLEQKMEKRMRTREYQIVTEYSGSLCPVFSFGFKIGCRPPCTVSLKLLTIKI